ncbi:MAG TPA: hypothetical protein VK106_06485, partial [Balneolaceae bacterium]|nr:hypothetical protein [Balneolaceae bacterium]
EAKKDYLLGLKENVVVGHKVPAGTGLRKYEDLIVGTKDEVDEETEEVGKVFEALGAEGEGNGEPKPAEVDEEKS